MKRAGIIAILVTILALLLAGFRYRLQKQWIDHRPYPLGATGLSYVAKQVQEFDGQEFAIFNFGNAEGVRLKLEGTIAAWDETTQSWKDRAWDLDLLPNRRVKEIAVGQEGKWKLQIRAYAAPTIGEKLGFRVRKAQSAGGLIGAWSSPEMWGSSPSTNGTVTVPVTQLNMRRRFDHIDLRVPADGGSGTILQHAAQSQWAIGQEKPERSKGESFLPGRPLPSLRMRSLGNTYFGALRRSPALPLNVARFSLKDFQPNRDPGAVYTAFVCAGMRRDMLY